MCSGEDKQNSVTPQKNRASVPAVTGSWVNYLEQVSGGSMKTRRMPPTVLLLIDCSDSMGAGEKLGQAKRGAVQFAESAVRRGYRVGVISFAASARTVAEPTDHVGSIVDGVEALVADGWTNMVAAIELAISLVSGKVGRKAICLVTDGLPNDPEGTRRIAKKARDLGFDLLTIGTDDADLSFLAELSSRKDLACFVERRQLEGGIARMAGLLPPPAGADVGGGAGAKP